MPRIKMGEEGIQTANAADTVLLDIVNDFLKNRVMKIAAEKGITDPDFTPGLHAQAEWWKDSILARMASRRIEKPKSKKAVLFGPRK